ncbi:PAS domain S-box protein [Oscillatoria acuminata]|uniref:histidine kinase n=1 Tax=Oscillatoria acuminata PCC 6304 TaxID=56110 RepID=K9TEB0_9CYAN|nr:PAS domain S-box protein [Oscillatoria acuminata]AFY80481.1 PAS domain S-box [Oscillatoria acuminata PCC 6304]
MILPRQIEFHRPPQSDHQDGDSGSIHPVFLQDNQPFQALFAAALDAMMIIDSRGYYLDINPAACSLLGLLPQDLIGCTLRDFTAPEFDFDQSWQTWLAQGQMCDQIQVVRPDWEVREVEYVANANFWADCHLLIFRDVTECKRAQEQVQHLLHNQEISPSASESHSQKTQLSEEEYRFQQLTRHLPGVIYQFCLLPDGQSYFPYASDGLRDIYGVAPSSVREDSAPVFESVHPEDLPRVTQTILESGKHLTPWRCEYRTCHPDGRLIWVLGHSTPQAEPDGSITWYGYVRDITELKAREKALQMSESKFRNLIDNLNDMVFIADMNGVFNYMSPAFNQIMGYPIADLLNRPFIEFIHPDDVQNYISEFEQALKGEKVLGSGHRVLHQDGNYYWHCTNVSPLLDDAGQMIACLGVTRYIHDQKQAEIALRESHIRLQLALDTTGTGTWECNLQTNEMVFSNNQWKKFLGYDLDEIIDQELLWENRVHPEDQAQMYQELEKHIKGETEIYKNEHRVRCKDGSYKWNLAIGKIVEWDDENNPARFIGIHNDVTDRKANELALFQLTEQLQKAQKVAHLGNWSIDVTTQKLTWSDEVFRIFGMTPNQGEPTFTEHFKQIHPDDLEFLQARVIEAEEGIPQNFDIRIFRPDGEVRCINVRAELEFRENQVVRMFGTTMDITERAQTENELYQSRELLRTILDALPQSVVWKNHHSVLLGCNQAFANAFQGESPEEFVGKTDYDLCWSLEEADSDRQSDREVMSGDLPILKFIETKPNSDGSNRWVETTKIPLHDRNGEVMGVVAILEDISDRIQAEAALRTSEEKLRSLFELCPLGIILNDIQGKFIEANAAASHLTGYTLAELNQLSYWDLTPEEYNKADEIQLKLLETTGRYGPYQKEYIHKQGYRVPVELIGLRIQDPNGDQYIWSVLADITERKAAEKALQDSEAQTRGLLEAIPDMMLRYNRDKVFVDYKYSAQVSMLVPPEQFLGKNLYEILPDFLAKPTGELIEETLKTQQMQSFEYELVMSEGARNYEARFSLCGEDVFSIIRDITDRKQAEVRLHSLLKRTQLLNHISTEIRNSLDLDTILQNAVNAIFAEIEIDICTFVWYHPDTTPHTLEVVKEQKNPQLASWLGFYPMDNYPQLFDNMLQGKMYRLDQVANSSDKSLKAWCQQAGLGTYLILPIHTAGLRMGGLEMGRIASDRPWQDDELELLQSIGTQVAIAIYQAQLYQDSQAKSQELQQAYRELQDTQVQLIQAEKMSSLGQLVAGVAHEINNPVSFIYGNLIHISDYTDHLLDLIQFYQNSYPNPPDEIMEFMEEIELDFLISDFPKIINSMKHGASRIRDIVKSLRTFSRLDESEVKAVDIHENIDSTLVILHSRLKGHGRVPEIQVIKQYGNLPQVECYSSLLNQVFMNLLMNAIEAIEERRNSLSPELLSDYVGCITVTTRLVLKNRVSIVIQDNGIGMNPLVQEKLFNPFFTTKAIGKGTGMGLSTSYQIVTKNHQGTLRFSSTEGVGTEFAVELPLK